MSKTSLAMLNQMGVPIDSFVSGCHIVGAQHIFNEEITLKIE